MAPAECRQTLRDASGGKPLDDTTLDTIAARAGRLPLALKVIGGLLALDITWPEIARELDAGHLQDVALDNSSIYTTLDVSVRLLPADQQARYRELVVFPADMPLNATAVARLWARTGGVSVFVAKKWLGEFKGRSLIQADNTLHDLQVDYLRAIVPADEAHALHSALCDAYAAATNPPEPTDPADDASPWSALPEDDDLYGWRFIATHLDHADRRPELEALLTDVTYLEGKIARLGIAATVSDLGLLSEAEPVRLVASVIRAGTLTLVEHPDELPNQVRGRWGSIPALHHAPERPGLSFDLYTQSLKPADPALVRVLSGHTNGLNAQAFSPDGRLALSASDDETLRLWEVASGQELRQFSGHTGWVLGCAFSPDGRLALSASYDGTLRLWEVATGMLRAVWHDETAIRYCAFSPLADRVMAGDSVGGVHLLLVVGVEASAAPTSAATQQATPTPSPEPKPRRRRFWPF